MSCEHVNVRFTLTPELKHHGREDCADCGRFLRWVPKPQTIERNKENARRIEFLGNAQLNMWEKQFVLTVRKQGSRLSPKQQTKLDEIYERHANKPKDS
jgi:hypothetical protein